jgi:hypothetical protein
LSFLIEGEIKTFHNEEKLRNSQLPSQHYTRYLKEFYVKKKLETGRLTKEQKGNKND